MTSVRTGAIAGLEAEVARLREELTAERSSKAELLAESGRLRAEQAASGDIIRIIGASPGNLAHALDAIAQSTARLCGTSDATIYRVDGEELVLVGRFGDLAHRWHGARSPIDVRLAHGVGVLKRRTVVVLDAQDDSDPLVTIAYAARRVSWEPGVSSSHRCWRTVKPSGSSSIGAQQWSRSRKRRWRSSARLLTRP
jgi:hypothetical protein